jgi:hypothetical protein
MKPNAKEQTAIVRNSVRTGLKLVLDSQCRCRRAGSGLEDGQHRVAGCIRDSAAVGDAVRVEGLPRGVERRDGHALVCRHQSGVRDGIRREDRR